MVRAHTMQCSTLYYGLEMFNEWTGWLLPILGPMASIPMASTNSAKSSLLGMRFEYHAFELITERPPSPKAYSIEVDKKKKNELTSKPIHKIFFFSYLFIYCVLLPVEEA